MMRYFLVTFHETDGNDSTVYDAIVSVPDQGECDRATDGNVSREEIAFDKVANAIERRLKDDGRPYSEDGDYGFYFDCAEDCGENCDGHGGIGMRGAEEFETLEQAKAACAVYHTRFFVEE